MTERKIQRRVGWWAALCAVAFMGACDGVTTTAGSDTAPPADQMAGDTGGSADPADVAATDAALAETADPADMSAGGPDTEALPSDTGDPSFVYPAGPYGTNVGDIMADLTFFSGADGVPVKLSEFAGTGKVLILVSAAGWCSACRQEARDLNAVNDLYADEGLILLYTLYEDDQQRDITHAFATQWQSALGLNYPVYQDRNYALKPYYTQNATPLNMVVTTADMKIRYVEVGFAEFQVLNKAKMYLYAK